ncbi:MAG: response regulator [Planctomycetota bacterium]|nr:response regulator [Planctomycetota bacterium]
MPDNPPTPNPGTPGVAGNPAVSDEQPVVLIVDDNEQNLELLSAYVEDLSCRVRIARDGLEATAEIDAATPDLILLDVMMPRMSGFQLCQRLRAAPKTKEVPIIVVTALTEMSDVERALEVGADDFLSKPVNRLELATRVRTLLRVSRLRRDVARLTAQLAQTPGSRE